MNLPQPDPTEKAALEAKWLGKRVKFTKIEPVKPRSKKTKTTEYSGPVESLYYCSIFKKWQATVQAASLLNGGLTICAVVNLDELTVID